MSSSPGSYCGVLQHICRPDYNLVWVQMLGAPGRQRLLLAPAESPPATQLSSPASCRRAARIHRASCPPTFTVCPGTPARILAPTKR
ncbi:hypothetical protein PBY51_021989 [Eleginops maclovinus]|uniref:Uncharacterized protein n=1 Tax=Eleginops maclovinus TaxID=56733 RepID=A0AAN7XGR8_ELEMC|nr:hypothetical protein PBY51_021989 [Eleginops maclovinus]